MSRDKFGRSSAEGHHAIRGPKGDGYNLTPEGDYDIEGKLLRNVKAPLVGTDAVNMDYVRSITPEEHANFYGFKNKKLANVADPQYDTDAVNLRIMNRSLKGVKDNLDSKVGKLDKKLTKTVSDQTQYSSDIDRIKRINTELNNKVGNLDKKQIQTEQVQTQYSKHIDQIKETNTEINSKLDDIEKRLTNTAGGQIRDSNDLNILRGQISDLPSYRARLTNLENVSNDITDSITHPVTGLVKINARLKAIELALSKKPQGSSGKPK